MWIRQLTSFNAYDIRGQLGENSNTNIAYRTGYAHDYCIPVILGQISQAHSYLNT